MFQVGRGLPVRGKGQGSDRGLCLHGAYTACVWRKPAKAFARTRARIVLAADEAVVAEAVQFREQERIVELLARRLVARWHACDLDMTGDPHHPPQRHGHVPVQDLTMVDVELQLEVREIQLVDQALREGEVI